MPILWSMLAGLEPVLLLTKQAYIKRMVEFKASYIGEWRDYKGRLPEIIFHGERGTPNGMAQFTPYPDGFFQLHGMTENITLFNDGLTKATPESSQPPINPQYLSYIENGWEPNALKQRTQNAIDYVSEFVQVFKLHKREIMRYMVGSKYQVMILPCASRICRCLPSCVMRWQKM